ncbi:hypothetical protein MAR_031719, partial [Mya arenaria]
PRGELILKLNGLTNLKGKPRFNSVRIMTNDHLCIKLGSPEDGQLGFDLFWDNPFSSVTYCFHYTLLTWIPCAVIWCYVAMVARTWYASGSGSLPSVPLSGLSLTKSILAFVLCCLNLVEMLHTHENSQTDETDSPSFYAACMIKAATY